MEHSLLWQDRVGGSGGRDSGRQRLILPTLRLTQHAGKVYDQSGIDSLDRCQDKTHFKNYTWPIQYHYNSRGFRDSEWPDDLQNAIWCVGDSFTVGIGQPFANTWPQVLASRTGTKTINFSMDGASNNWIARRARDIITMVNPRNMVIMWSYVERRERLDFLHQEWQKIYSQLRDPSWPAQISLADVYTLPSHIIHEIQSMHGIDIEFFQDCNDHCMIYQDAGASDQDNFENWCRCVDMIARYPQVIHAVIPQWVHDPSTNTRYWNYLAQAVEKTVQPFNRLDLARDGHHFDILTSQRVAELVLSLLR